MSYHLKNKGHHPSMSTKGARDDARQYESSNARLRKKKQGDGYFDKSFDFRNFIFAPEGFEHIFFGIYFFVLPYLAGLAFLYLFIAEGNFEFFIEFDLFSYFIVWSIGYEAIAGTILAFILLNWIRHLGKKKEPETKKHRHGRF